MQEYKKKIMIQTYTHTHIHIARNIWQKISPTSSIIMLNVDRFKISIKGHAWQYGLERKDDKT